MGLLNFLKRLFGFGRKDKPQREVSENKANDIVPGQEENHLQTQTAPEIISEETVEKVIPKCQGLGTSEELKDLSLEIENEDLLLTPAPAKASLPSECPLPEHGITFESQQPKEIIEEVNADRLSTEDKEPVEQATTSHNEEGFSRLIDVSELMSAIENIENQSLKKTINHENHHKTDDKSTKLTREERKALREKRKAEKDQQDIELLKEIVASTHNSATELLRSIRNRVNRNECRDRLNIIAQATGVESLYECHWSKIRPWDVRNYIVKWKKEGKTEHSIYAILLVLQKVLTDELYNGLYEEKYLKSFNAILEENNPNRIVEKPRPVFKHGKPIDIRKSVMRSRDRSRQSLAVYKSLSGGYTNFTEYEIEGTSPRFKDTKVIQYLYAKTKQEAISKAQMSGLGEPFTFKVRNFEPISETQLAMAKEMGIELPSDASRTDYYDTQMFWLDRYVAPSESLLLYAHDMGVYFSKFVSFDTLLKHMQQDMPEKDLAAFYCYMVYIKWQAVGDQLFEELPSTDEALLLIHASHLYEDPRLHEKYGYFVQMAEEAKADRLIWSMRHTNLFKAQGIQAKVNVHQGILKIFKEFLPKLQ